MTCKDPLKLITFNVTVGKLNQNIQETHGVTTLVSADNVCIFYYQMST